MKKYPLVTIGLASFLATFIISTQAFAVDPAIAVANLAKLATISAESKGNLSEAALSGDVDAIADASKRSDAIDAALAEGQEAYSVMERALVSGDQNAADAAAADLFAAVDKAMNALNGVIPDSVATGGEQKKAAPNRGGPGRPFDAPNYYENISDTAVQRGILQEVFGGFWASSSFGTRQGYGDSEATPE